ncbi:activating signal cointegrator 1 complex subunit 2 [Diabrotica undecimpunctata]|uniref:activating signal cointegrator 1 complex subunit 2 n=1 Tax=Diabrotica undecimpunctata TaxID=50387 RepID=UPI003B63BA9E
MSVKEIKNVNANLNKLSLNENPNENIKYQFVSVFKNPSKLPINQIHLERTWYELKKDIPKDLDLFAASEDELQKKLYDKKTEIIPALDKRWLPKVILYNYEPYVFTESEEENIGFITNNVHFIDSLQYLLKCNFHQFWCTILFEPSAAVSLRSFILNPVTSHQLAYLENEYADVYKTVFKTFLLVYRRLVTFKVSESEYMPKDYGYEQLLEKKLINLPIVTTLALLYKESNVDFVNILTSLYFDNTSQLDFRFKEIEESINQTLLVMEMIGGHVCGFSEGAVVVPIAIGPRPPVFDLTWIYSVVNYLLNTMALLHTLLEFYKPAIEMCIEKDLPFRIPFTYVSIYRELYEFISDREDLELQKTLSERVFDEINIGRSEFVDVYHLFVTHCLDKTLECMGDDKKQEDLVELYLKLMTVALEDDYFICDYNMKYNVSNQNEMFASCTLIDHTRTEFIISCINKLPRHKKLQRLSKLKKQTVEDIFKKFKPPEIEVEEEPEPTAGPSNINGGVSDDDIESKIKEIVDTLPHLGDGFVLQCLESYNFNSAEVINAILEENLPPHLSNIPFDQIRIPPEPESEKPVLAYHGKKPDYDDTLKLLNDKRDFKEIKSFVLEGVQYTNNYLYDDEYDDRDFDDVPIKVADNQLEKEILTYNPNHEDAASDSSESEESDQNQAKGVSRTAVDSNPSGSGTNRSKMNFCEDPALIRERREARFRTQHRPPPKGNVVGKAKGQGQEKDVLKARDKKTVNKSSRANHNRKGGAQWKRNKGMIPM